MDHFKKLNDFSQLILLGPLELECPSRAQSEHPVLMIDGGMRHEKHISKACPYQFSLGDNDSNTISHVEIKLNPHKNFTDLEYALTNLPNSIQTIYADGFIGGKLDHQLVVLGNFSDWLRRKSDPPLKVELGAKISGYSAGDYSIQHKGRFSVLSFRDARFKITGDCEYKLENQIITTLSGHLISNIAHGTFEVECDHSFFIFF